MTVLPVALSSLTTMVKLYIVKTLVADLILSVNYLYHVGATIDFDNEILRLHQRGSGMLATVPFAKVDQAHRRETSICAIRTVPLDPFEQKLVDVRMPTDRVGDPGVVSQYGATLMGSAAVAHGYFDNVPKRAEILIANPTTETVAHAGTRIGSIIPTHLDPDDPMVVGAVCIQREL
jgi:hypothetical protein